MDEITKQANDKLTSILESVTGSQSQCNQDKSSPGEADSVTQSTDGRGRALLDRRSYIQLGGAGVATVLVSGGLATGALSNEERVFSTDFSEYTQ